MAGAIIPDDWDGVTYQCTRIMWPASGLWQAILLGQITEASTPEYWDADSGDPDDAANAVEEAYSQTVPDIYSEECGEVEDMEQVGSVKFWPAQSDPVNWMKCDGAVLNKDAFPELFAVIGYTFGGSGDNFELPDAGDKFLLPTPNIFEYHEVGDEGGEETHTLISAEMPGHSHHRAHFYESGTAGFDPDFQQHVQGTGTYLGPGETGDTGGDGAHNNVPPYLVLNLIIKIQMEGA